MLGLFDRNLRADFSKGSGKRSIRVLRPVPGNNCAVALNSNPGKWQLNSSGGFELSGQDEAHLLQSRFGEHAPILASTGTLNLRARKTFRGRCFRQRRSRRSVPAPLFPSMPPPKKEHLRLPRSPVLFPPSNAWPASFVRV